MNAARLAAGLLSLLLVLGAVEGLCALAFTLFTERFTFFDPADFLLEEDRIEQAKAIYDRELGWLKRYRTPFGERPRPEEYGAALLSVFGDSFTHGDQVRDDETFETFLARRLRADVYNFGVGGYGTDQALVRFRRDFPKARTPVVGLGFTIENINRLFAVYRRFYFPKTSIPLPKPRFELSQGRLKLVPNPLRSAADIPRLRDPGFIAALGEQDLWYNRDRLPVLAFPFSRILFNRRIWLEAWYGRAEAPVDDSDPRPWENLWERKEARDLLFAIFDAFAAEARAQGARPILLLLPRKRETRRSWSGEPVPERDLFTGFCRERSYPCFDGIGTLSGRVRRAEELDSLFLPHLAPRAQRIIARGLADFLIAAGLVR